MRRRWRRRLGSASGSTTSRGWPGDRLRGLGARPCGAKQVRLRALTTRDAHNNQPTTMMRRWNMACGRGAKTMNAAGLEDGLGDLTGSQESPRACGLEVGGHVIWGDG